MHRLKSTCFLFNLEAKGVNKVLFFHQKKAESVIIFSLLHIFCRHFFISYQLNVAVYTTSMGIIKLRKKK